MPTQSSHQEFFKYLYFYCWVNVFINTTLDIKHMKHASKFVSKIFLCLTATIFLIDEAFASSCAGHGIELQVLGSGGPEMQDKRASSSYLIWQDGMARVLIDSGGGSALRFGESGANMTDLYVVLFTHLHVDHTADFPALIKSSYFEDRSKPLPVYGPTGNTLFPSTTEFIQDLFGTKGAYRYLNDFLTTSQSSYVIQAHNVEFKNQRIKEVFNQSGVIATATDVVHGSVPALAWRVDIGGKSIVFSGDTNGGNGNLQLLAKDADILVAHNAVPEGASGVERKLHMPPSVIGQIAVEANIKQLVLSHRMLRTLGKEPQTLEVISHSFNGKTMFANDLDCFTP
ncbi:beta-lactamase-like protein [Methylotenera versatilis 301]|uniref:Beta-lactamase-like protein n=2 Tax=Methylotenera TaxID=359407 RepID=D7DJI6_METV0|nr:beta-lactamase-like protein [Methylotenera versatilis 301]